MLIDDEIINDGADMISYLDRKLQQNAQERNITTGIIVGTRVRLELTRACQKVMGQVGKPDMTVNRFRNILLIEDGNNLDRLEVIYGVKVVMPAEGPGVLNFKKIRDNF